MSISQTTNNRTNTSLFLLPGIGLNISDIKEYGFVNAYISDKNREHYPNCVYVLFKPNDPTIFTLYFISTEYKRTHLLIDDYDYARGYIVLVYQFPEEYEQEYRSFLKGKYSQFRRKYKDLFPQEIHSEDEVGPFTQPSFFHHVFNKTRMLEEYWVKRIGEKPDKEGEYWSIPDLDDETLDINKLYENDK